MIIYADCTYCGGEVMEKKIDYDYRRDKHLMVVSNCLCRGLSPVRREVL